MNRGIGLATISQQLRSGAYYFACVFGAGFILGAIRVPLLVPRLGVRVAELIEITVMFVVIYGSAKWIVRRHRLPPGIAGRWMTGVFALILALGAELLLVLGLQGIPVSQYIASRDPVSGTMYGVMLLVFALMPLLVEC